MNNIRSVQLCSHRSNNISFNMKHLMIVVIIAFSMIAGFPVEDQPKGEENQMITEKPMDQNNSTESQNDIMFGAKTNQSVNEYPEAKKMVNGSNNSSTDVKKIVDPVPVMNELKTSKGKDEQKTSEVKKDREYLPPAIQVPQIGSNYQILSWSTPRANQYTLANIRYDGPIAIPPGYDQLGAPLPVQDTPEVAQDKAARLAALFKAGGDIYPATQNIKSRLYQGDTWSEQQASLPFFASFNQIAQSNPAIPSVSIGSDLGQPWSAPQTSQLNIRYTGPIAIPPGYDESGAPFPVLDTPEVAQAKANRLAALAKAGGDIYPAVHQHYPGIDNGDGTYRAGSASISDQTTVSSTLGIVDGKSKSSSPIINQDQEKSAYIGLKGISSSTVNDSSMIPNMYQSSASWLSTQANQIASAYNKYNGPIAIPPGYDENGAPLPVFDTPDVAQAKALYNDIYAKTLANLIANGLYDQEAEEYNVW